MTLYKSSFTVSCDSRLVVAACVELSPLTFGDSAVFEASFVVFGVYSQGFSVSTIYFGDGLFYDTYYDVWYYDPYYDPYYGEWRYDPLLCAWFFIYFSGNEDIETIATVIVAAAIITEIAGADCSIAENRSPSSFNAIALLAGLAAAVGFRRQAGAT